MLNAPRHWACNESEERHFSTTDKNINKKRRMTSSHRNGSKSKLSEIKENWPEFTKACKEEGQFNKFLDLAKIPGILEHQDERTKKTCLHFACENKNIKTLKWILNNFARDQIINLTDSLNRSAIFFAARSSAQESVRCRAGRLDS